MCGICGVLGGQADWSSPQGQRPLGGPGTMRAERARMVGLLDRIARTRSLRISDWQGCAYLVAGATGGQELAASLAQVWLALDRLGGSAIDPLAQEWLSQPQAGGPHQPQTGGPRQPQAGAGGGR